MLSRSFLLLTCCLLTTLASSQSNPPELNVMPLPATYKMGQGQLSVDQHFFVHVSGYEEPRLDRAVQRFLNVLSRRTGASYLSPCIGTCVGLNVITDHASKPVQELGEDESYSLDVTASGANLKAPTPLGTIHGLQTFLHLVQATPTGYAVPAVSIQDKPRFPWRGLMVDVGRHFMPLDSLRRTLDGMEAVQLKNRARVG